MKPIRFFSSALIVFLFAFLMVQPLVEAQASKQVETIINGVTVANSATKTGYVYNLLGTDTKPTSDSVSFRITATGEIDLDEIDITPGVMYGGVFYATSSAVTTALTINNAAATTTIVTISASTMSTNSIEGIDTYKVEVIAAASGNDATDPNSLIVEIIRHTGLVVYKVSK